jgi:phosphatidylserine/phosphatidylglycerophosphate/cardiolipin synthase-like enzyme
MEVPSTLIRAEPEHLAHFADAMSSADAKCVFNYTPLNPLPGTFSVTGEFRAFASPDSVYAVLKQLIDRAETSIHIGMYDFTARYLRDLLESALQRGVKITLLLDLAPNDSRASAIYNGLQSDHPPADCCVAPSCRNAAKAHLFAVSHQKVLIVDESWCVVYSGNFSEASVPLNPK